MTTFLGYTLTELEAMTDCTRVQPRNFNSPVYTILKGQPKLDAVRKAIIDIKTKAPRINIAMHPETVEDLWFENNSPVQAVQVPYDTQRNGRATIFGIDISENPNMPPGAVIIGDFDPADIRITETLKPEPKFIEMRIVREKDFVPNPEEDTGSFTQGIHKAHPGGIVVHPNDYAAMQEAAAIQTYINTELRWAMGREFDNGE